VREKVKELRRENEPVREREKVHQLEIERESEPVRERESEPVREIES